MAPTAPRDVTRVRRTAAGAGRRGPRPSATATARSPATRSRRTSAPSRSPRRRQPQAPRAPRSTGLTNGHELHVHASPRPTRSGPGRPPAASNAVDPAEHALRASATPANVDIGRHRLGRARRQVPRPTPPARSPASASTRPRRTPARTSAACGPRPGRGSPRSTFTNESASGWQTATFVGPVSITAGTTYIASYYAPRRPLLGLRPRASSQRLRQPAAARAGAAARPATASTSTASPAASRRTSYNSADYGVDVMFALPKPGAVSNVAAAEAGATAANVTWTAPTTGGTPTSYTITPYDGHDRAGVLDRSPRRPSRRRSAGLTHRPQLPLHRPGGQRQRRRPRLRPVELRSRRPRPIAPGAPHRRGRAPDHARPAQVSWTAPDDDGDSPITGYTITPYIGATAQDPVDVAGATTTKTITGLTNGTAYTFRVKATNAIGTGPELAPRPRRATPGYTLFELATPDDGGRGRRRRRRARRQVPRRPRRHGDRRALLQGRRQHRHATSAASGRPAGTRLAQVDVQRRDARPAGRRPAFATPVAADARARPTWCRYYAPNGHYSVTGRGLSTPPSTTRPCTRWRVPSTTTASSRYGSSARRSRPTRTTPATTGSTVTFAAARCPARRPA